MVMAYTGTAHIDLVYIALDFKITAYMAIAYTVTAHIAMACIVMAYIVIAPARAN